MGTDLKNSKRKYPPAGVRSLYGLVAKNTAAVLNYSSLDLHNVA